ncbi:hypothetical protein BGZ61DRAFT_550210, partial [Ilyonectria robusta]|uniref:uncharacterized protein n=1 Tax=Ilyonectria robusta TaxID=1079257 RepID=UPI001E8EE853
TICTSAAILPLLFWPVRFAPGLSVLFSVLQSCSPVIHTALYPLPITSHHHRMRIDDCPMPHARHHTRGLSRRPTGCRRPSPAPSAQCHGLTAVALADGSALLRMQRNNQTPANELLILQIRRRLLTNRMARHPTQGTLGARAAQRITTTWSSRVASVERSTRALHPPTTITTRLILGTNTSTLECARIAGPHWLKWRGTMRKTLPCPHGTWHRRTWHVHPASRPSARPPALNAGSFTAPLLNQQTSSPVGSLGDDSIQVIQAPVFDASGTVSPPRLDKRSVFLHDTTTDRSGNLSSHCPSPSSCTPTSHS